MSNFSFLLKITLSGGIARRYFVVNGFDGALTMLGLLSGFIVSGKTDLSLALSVCMGAAVALGISGFSSAYVSETAEREKWLQELQDATLSGLTKSAHARAARLVPIYIAAVNGLAPLVIALFIMLPLWFSHLSIINFAKPYFIATGFAFAALFALGAFLGNVSGRFWFISGLKTVLIGLVTMALVLILGKF